MSMGDTLRLEKDQKSFDAKSFGRYSHEFICKTELC